MGCFNNIFFAVYSDALATDDIIAVSMCQERG